MKKLLLVLCALTLSSSALFAQNKFGRIDYPAVIQSMPEMKDVELNFNKAQKEYEDHLEGMQVELNTKTNDYQKLPSTTSETTRQLKARDISDLQQRLQAYYQTAQTELEKVEADLMKPLQDKANAAVKKVSKASGILVVFQIGSVVYIDEEATVDITDKVKAEVSGPAKK